MLFGVAPPRITFVPVPLAFTASEHHGNVYDDPPLRGGIGMAFFKTLTGSVLNLWLLINYRLLEEGTVHLVTHLTELGERRHADA